MSIEQHVVDLPTSRKLAPYVEGVESEFVWITTTENTDHLFVSVEAFKEAFLMMKGRDPLIKDARSAFILGELLKMLPKQISSDQVKDIELVDSSGDQLHFRIMTPYNIHYDSDKYGLLIGSLFQFDKLTNPETTAAQLLIWLHEGGYMKEGV